MNTLDGRTVLTIRRQQLQTLSRDEGYVRFVEQMIDHLRKHFSVELGPVEDFVLAEDVDAALQRARAHGLTSRRDCARYLGLAASLGWDFDTARPWVGPLLRDTARSPSDRLAQVFERAIEELQREADTLARRRKLGI
jgi:hypothetical protein